MNVAKHNDTQLNDN
jgi:hypothetical protein